MWAWLAAFFASRAAGMASATFGFAGSLVLVWAAWKTIRLRRAIIETGRIDSGDPHVMMGVSILRGRLDHEQLAELDREHRLYLIGASLLAAGFLVAFLHELA